MDEREEQNAEVNDDGRVDGSAVHDAIVEGTNAGEKFFELRRQANIEQAQNDAIFGVGDRPENRDLGQEATYFFADEGAYPDIARAREQVTNATNDQELINAERLRFRPRNDPQREVGTDTTTDENPEIVLNQDMSR